jgi:hypothetical protein
MSKRRWLKYFKVSIGVASLTVVVWTGTELLGTNLPTTAGDSTDIFTNKRNFTVSQDPFPIAQRRVRPQEVWPFVYQELPDLPLENDYISQETGEVDAENTLVSRLIRYHLYVKGRPPNYRFDWKLTLADYLGANDFLQSSVYPGHDDLTENPMEGDREAIQSLTRSQRETLINRLVEIFDGNPAPPSIPQVQEKNNPGRSAPRAPIIPQPGDADLLRF